MDSSRNYMAWSLTSGSQFNFKSGQRNLFELKPTTLLCGKNITKDKLLFKDLEVKTNLLFFNDQSQISENFNFTEIDLVVLEYSDSLHDHLEFIRHLKKASPLVPIVVVSNSDSMEATVLSFRYGAKDFFKKPYKVDLLIERIDALLHEKNMLSQDNIESNKTKIF